MYSQSVAAARGVHFFSGMFMRYSCDNLLEFQALI